MIRLRKFSFQLHKWLGIILAILVIPISLSGAALVWHDWLDEAVNPQRYPSVGAAALPPSAYAARAEHLLKSGERISSISFPVESGSVQATLVKAAEGGGRPSRAWVWMDPRTAEPIERAESGEGLVRVLHVLHGSLMVPGMGRQIVGWVGVAMLISSLTGIWLWWPLTGSFRRGLRWKRRPNLDANLHFQSGFWISLPLAALSFTGVWISFPSVFNQFNGASASALRSSGPGGAALPLARPRLSPDETVVAARGAASGQLESISWPTGRNAQWTVRFGTKGLPAEVKVQDLDASVSVEPQRPETLARTMRRIHDGTGMPAVWQIIIFVGGILPALLAVTGILMWLRMRMRKRHGRQRRGRVIQSGALAN